MATTLPKTLSNSFHSMKIIVIWFKCLDNLFLRFKLIVSVGWKSLSLEEITNHCLMMTLSDGDIFRVTVPQCGEFTGHLWIPLTKASEEELWCSLWSAPEQTNAWAKNRDAADLRRHRTRYDAIVMLHNNITMRSPTLTCGCQLITCASWFYWLILVRWCFSDHYKLLMIQSILDQGKFQLWANYIMYCLPVVNSGIRVS